MVTSEMVRQVVSLHGDVRIQASSDWRGSFSLPEEIAKFYREVGPLNLSIETYGNPFFIPSLADLWQFQAGYRWNGISGEPIADWNDDWLVVADQGGDPFMYSRETGRILHAQHGEGDWVAGEVFQDLNEMAACFSVLGSIAVEAATSFTDEDSYIHSKWQTKALSQLHTLLGSEELSRKALTVLGWRIA